MRQLVVTIALAMLAVLGLGLYGREMQARGRLQAEYATLRAANDSLKRVAARIDTVYRVQRDTFYVRRVRLDTLTVTVDRWKHDTLEVVRYVAAADSTVRACSLALATCDERVGVRDARIATLERTVRAMPKPRSPFWVWTERLVIGAVSFKVGQATAPRD